MADPFTPPPPVGNPGLYDPAVRELVRESLQHLWSVTFRDFAGEQIPIDVVECELTLDRGWWPYVQGSVTAVVPADQGTLDRLDPRRIVTVEVRAGYVLPDGARDEHPLALLYLSGRSVRRPDNTIQLSVQGQEYLLGRAVGTQMPYAADPTYTVADAVIAHKDQQVRWSVGYALSTPGVGSLLGIGAEGGANWDFDHASTLTGWSGGTAGSPGTYPERYGADTPFPGVVMVDVARDIANLTGCWLRCDETGVWRCTGPNNPAPPAEVSALWLPPKYTLPPTAAVLTVGAGGTVIESDTAFDRDGEWANMIVTHHSWKADTSGRGRTGLARVTSGPFNVDTVGSVARTLDFEDRGYVSQHTANARAGYALRRMLNLGRTITLGAVAMYWLRPEQGVTVQLPLGPQEAHIVESVTYTLREGRMSLRSLLPDTTSTITLGGA